jgi:hypothetical protein
VINERRQKEWVCSAMSWTKALAYNSEEYENSPVPGAMDLCGGDVNAVPYENLYDALMFSRQQTWILESEDYVTEPRCQWNLFVLHACICHHTDEERIFAYRTARYIRRYNSTSFCIGQ